MGIRTRLKWATATVQETAAQFDLQEPAVRSMKWWLFQSSRINKLELAAQTCPRWNRLQHWFELVGAFKDAA